jgi:allophanate hydrolase
MESSMRNEQLGWTLGEWQAAYRSQALTPDILLTMASTFPDEDNAWISRVQPQQLRDQLAQLAERLAAVDGDIDQLPLYGVPFAIKDNIDAAGWETTAACPEFAYTAAADASVVARLRAAGAILMGKTNLDQFATGLVGTRSPYGAVGNSFNPDYVSGGSSSGSASVVARRASTISSG